MVFSLDLVGTVRKGEVEESPLSTKTQGEPTKHNSMEAFIFLIRHIKPRCLPSVALTPGGLLVYQWQPDRSAQPLLSNI